MRCGSGLLILPTILAAFMASSSPVAAVEVSPEQCKILLDNLVKAFGASQAIQKKTLEIHLSSLNTIVSAKMIMTSPPSDPSEVENIIKFSGETSDFLNQLSGSHAEMIESMAEITRVTSTICPHK